MRQIATIEKGGCVLGDFNVIRRMEEMKGSVSDFNVMIWYLYISLI